MSTATGLAKSRVTEDQSPAILLGRDVVRAVPVDSPWSFSASVVLHVILSLAATTTWTYQQLKTEKSMIVTKVDILRTPRPEKKPEKKSMPPAVSSRLERMIAPLEHAEGPKGPPPPFSFDPDTGSPQQLPVVLARWKGCVAFGRAAEAGTIRAKLCGPGFGSKEVLSEAAAVVDHGYEVDLQEADRWEFIRTVRAACTECGDLGTVWALFPWEFGEALIDRLRNEAGEPTARPVPLVVKFESQDTMGITIRKGRAE